ncbi:DUF5518 domain-containing protein [Natrarchaeobius chitinivorans]|uniref:DUF5518 domain-containing protein n=1 Tax=Natrarchaeobius chitinivorans TaxID=1679083 RepID=A0A3N6M7Z7_NATCH|nr:DUF5518 domain-containing protein [Natrarchaeobius chitinivorans]RQG92300.1 hypothetical protein EA473_17395 [Natrarchaeobius chitinivorans]
MTNRSTWINAAIGAVTTIALSFTGFSPLLGGGIAGYLQRETPKRGAKAGAISGAIATIPLVLVMCIGLLLYAGIPAASPGAPGGLELAIIFLIMLPMLALWFVGLSTAGGYLGGYLHTNSRPPTGDNLGVER